MKYCIRDAESGILLDEFETREEAEATLNQYEEADQKDGLYIPDQYEISEE